MIDWIVKKQFIVSIFIIEAKLFSMLHVDKKFIWWIHLFQKLKFNSNQKIMIYNDNLQIIRLFISKILKTETKFRHVDIAQCWLKQLIQSDYFLMNYLYRKNDSERINKDCIITETSRVHKSIETRRCRTFDQSSRMQNIRKRWKKIFFALTSKEVWLNNCESIKILFRKELYEISNLLRFELKIFDSKRILSIRIKNLISIEIF
jgi:hypothetical protein